MIKIKLNKIYYSNLLYNTNLKLIKLAKDEILNKYYENIRIEKKKEVDKLLEKNIIRYVGEDKFYYIYEYININTEDYYITVKNNTGFTPTNIYFNKGILDSYIINIKNEGNIELSFLGSFSNNWKLKKINIDKEILQDYENCINYIFTKNTYCLINKTDIHKIGNKYKTQEVFSDTLKLTETESGRNKFTFYNQEESYYVLYYKSNPLRNIFKLTQNLGIK